MNLIVGSTGFLGSEITRQLITNRKPVKALVRTTSDPSKVDALKGEGVECVVADLKDRTSLDAACKDVKTVITTASATFSRQDGDSIETVDLEGQLNLVEAALDAGVEHFIYVSFRCRENQALEYPLKEAKRSVEDRLIESGLNYTILQPSYFMEVWLSPAVGFDFVNKSAQIYGTGQNKISWISLNDVAQYAVSSVDNPDVHNKTLELGGPNALSPLDVVAIFEEISGQAFAVNHVPVEALHGQKQAATESLEETFAALMLQYAEGDVVDIEAAKQLIPIELSSVSNYAEQVLAPA